MTNSHLSDDLVNQARTEEEKQELLEIQLSTFQMLADDLEAKVTTARKEISELTVDFCCCRANSQEHERRKLSLIT